MKSSLVTSAVVHSLLLSWALVSIGAPASFDVADVEALPVDIIPIESITQIQQGDKKAPLAETAAPVPTQKPNIVEDAENVGDNDVDLKSPPTPSQKPARTEIAAAPEKTERPLPTKDTETNDIKDIVKEETAAPTEVAALPDPKPEIKPEPQPEAKPEPQPAEQAAEQIPLPESVPLPAARPKPPEQKPAESKPVEKPSDKKPAEKKQETAKSTSTKDSDFNADEVAALLNKQDAAGGGAKRSTEQAALGGKKTTSGSTLSQSELDALRGQIQNNWSIIPGMADASDVRIRVKFRLDESGQIIGEPEVTATGGSESARRTLANGARRAVLRSTPFSNLPADKYDAWSEVVVNFDPSDLL